MSNAIPPSVTYPSPNEWPETIKSISGITNASVAEVTCTDHTFTTQDESVTTVLFKQVSGMLPINGLPGLIQQVIDDDHFTVNIDTTGFPVYRGGGVISIVTGQPPIETVGFQTFNTPFHNIA
jgi:hypothetical protein